MAFTESQQQIWQSIERVYQDWQQGQRPASWMPVVQLAARLPDVAPNAIGAVLAEASENGHADVDSLAEDPSFRVSS